MTTPDIRILGVPPGCDWVCSCCGIGDDVQLVRVGWNKRLNDQQTLHGGYTHQLCRACRRALIGVLQEVTA